MSRRPDVPVYHPDVLAWEMFDAAGQSAGLFLQDNFARQTKRSGAWMSDFNFQSVNRGVARPVIVNNNNFAKGAPGEPTLLSFDDAQTLFHEFGHGLHGLLTLILTIVLAAAGFGAQYRAASGRNVYAAMRL